MNQTKGIIVLLVLLSGSFVPSESFAQTNDDSLFSLFDLLAQLFSSGNVTVITNSDSISDFDQATIVFSSNNSINDDSDKSDENKDRNNVPSFVNAVAESSSDTSIGNDEKVTLCHIPPGNPAKAHTITVGNPAVAAHLAHGDYLGECMQDSVSHIDELDVQEFENATVEMSSDTSVDSKTTLCHVPPGNPSKAHTITVSSSAVDAHMAHGDYIGECLTADNSDSDESKQPKEKGNKAKGNGKNKN